MSDMIGPYRGARRVLRWRVIFQEAALLAISLILITIGAALITAAMIGELIKFATY